MLAVGALPERPAPGMDGRTSWEAAQITCRSVAKPGNRFAWASDGLYASGFFATWTAAMPPV